MPAIRVLVADGLRLVGESLARALTWYPEFEILAVQPVAGPQALETVQHMAPDVVVMDYWIPEMDGPAATSVILRKAPGTQVLLTSWLYGPGEVENALRAGAAGFLPKSMGVDQVAEAIRRAHRGETPVFEAELSKMTQAVKERGARAAQIRQVMSTLTPREIEMLRMLSYGHSIADIAKQLFISQGTVKLHFHHIVQKTGAKSKEQALALARYCGLITS